jgi:pSer/pThr/pTyr-binding forkhead associated (FHA) protein
MPTLTLVSGRTPVQVYEINSLVVGIGRDQDMDIVVDHASVSRRHVQVRLEPSGRWAVEDLDSANGSFLNGRRLAAREPLARGDEIAFGAFSLFFDRTFDDVGPARAARRGPVPAPAPTETIHMDQEDVARLQREVALKRRAHLRWEARGARGTYYLDPAERAAVLVGRSPLCDLRVPAGPRHDLLVSRRGAGFEVRNLSGWHRLRVNGRLTRQALLRSGDVLDVGRQLRLTFVDALD